MGPLEAAEAIRLLGVSRVIPMHYGTLPILAGTPDQLREFTRDVPGLQIYALQPGESVTF
jgi:L-ascorbate metabolism protein UlaG (beta-lactamase superfamily)